MKKTNVGFWALATAAVCVYLVANKASQQRYIPLPSALKTPHH